MGQDETTNHPINNERLQTEYNNTMNEKEDNNNINVNKSHYLPGIQSLNNNTNTNTSYTSRKIFLPKKNDLINSANNVSNKYYLNKNKSNTNNILEQSSFITKDIPKYINIYSEYFKCISCPMCILININPKTNLVKISCENGHNNEMNIESFISIYKYFKYICDKCKKELSSKFYYCCQCKELFCEFCLRKMAEISKHKGHLFLNEKEVNFFCTRHKKKLVNFCNNCKKNCCKKCSSLHSSHELLLIKNEIREINNIEEIEKLLNKEKIIIEKIEEKYSINFFKNQNPKYLKSFNKLLSCRKLEYQLKNKILTTYKNYINSIKSNDNVSPSIYDSNLDISLSSISSNLSTNEYGNNFLMNYYFLKTVNDLENEILSNQSDYFNISEENKYYKDFSELKQYLFNYKKNIIEPEKNLDNFTKYLTIYQKPNYIFPLDDGNFIITYNTKIIFYDGLYGDELLVLDEEIFDYTYKIIKLTDDTLLFFGDFLNHVKIEEDGDIKILFTGSHIEILKEIVPYDNNIVFIDKITAKLNILTNKDINWHKEPFPEFSLCTNYNKNENNYDYDVSFLHNESDMNIDLNSSILTTYKKKKYLDGRNNTENKLNKSFTTINNNQNTRELFLNSIKNIRQEKINNKIKNNNIISNKIKSFDILSLNDSCFIALQERNLNRNELCFRIFDYNDEENDDDNNNNNNIFKLVDIIHLEEEPLRKSGVLSLINSEKNNNYIGYGLNDKKFFVIFDLEKKIITTKVYLNYNTYRFFDNMLLFNYHNSIYQYIIKDNEFLYVTKMPFQGIIHSLNYLKNYTLLIDNKKFTYMYTYSKNNENI